MPKDYYEILGVTKDANADAIKKAWRKLRTKLHPDKGGDSEAFKEAKDAYECLSIPSKRAVYDQFGTSGSIHEFNSNRHTQPDLEELLRRAQQGRNAAYSAALSVQKIQIPVDQMINGGQVTFRYIMPNGNQPLSFVHSIATVMLKPNTKIDEKITIGNIPNTSFIFIPASTPQCLVQGIDLVVPFEVNALAAAVGNKCKVTHPNGKTYQLSIPPGTPNGKALRLPGMGLHHSNGAKGSLIAVIDYVIPILSAKEQTALKELLDSA
jgi:DnaJ-class molecular chaperone